MLISAIMPTGNRAGLAALALECFQRQTYVERELIVLDDGSRSSAWLFTGLPGVRYYRLATVTDRTAALGDKRNTLVNLAKGEIVIHWDDDDWSAPRRMADQAARLVCSGKSVTGYHDLPYWDEVGRQAYCYRYQGPGPYACGTSLCYRRAWALDHRFRSLNLGEDTAFSHQAAAAGEMVSTDNQGMLVARHHAQSTSKVPLGTRAFPKMDVRLMPAQFFEDVARSANVCTAEEIGNLELETGRKAPG